MMKSPIGVFAPSAIECSRKGLFLPRRGTGQITVIYVVTTGGTIEKVYSEQTGEVRNLDSKIDRYLRLLRLPDSDVRIIPLMNIDSLHMTDADRGAILGTIRTLLQ